MNLRTLDPDKARVARQGDGNQYVWYSSGDPNVYQYHDGKCVASWEPLEQTVDAVVASIRSTEGRK